MFSNQYEYNVRNVKACAPVSAGVYRLNYETGGKTYVFYVGQAMNLEQRLLDHLQPSEPNACIRHKLSSYTCYFQYVEVPSKYDRDRIEQEQIGKFSPDCNRI